MKFISRVTIKIHILEPLNVHISIRILLNIEILRILEYIRVYLDFGISIIRISGSGYPNI